MPCLSRTHGSVALEGLAYLTEPLPMAVQLRRPKLRVSLLPFKPSITILTKLTKPLKTFFTILTNLTARGFSDWRPRESEIYTRPYATWVARRMFRRWWCCRRHSIPGQHPSRCRRGQTIPLHCTVSYNRQTLLNRRALLILHRRGKRLACIPRPVWRFSRCTICCDSGGGEGRRKTAGGGEVRLCTVSSSIASLVENDSTLIWTRDGFGSYFKQPLKMTHCRNAD